MNFCRYTDISDNADAVELHGVKVVHLDTALFFGSRERLYDFIKEIVHDGVRLIMCDIEWQSLAWDKQYFWRVS